LFEDGAELQSSSARAASGVEGWRDIGIKDLYKMVLLKEIGGKD
jgi:hypothetical protein